MELNQLVTQWKASSDENEGDVNNTDEWKYDRDLILGFISASLICTTPRFDFISHGLIFFFLSYDDHFLNPHAVVPWVLTKSSVNELESD